MVVLVVFLEVVGQIADALREDRNLHFGAASITLIAGVVSNDFLLLFGGHRHNISFLLSDIGKVETPHDRGRAIRDFHQRDRNSAQFRQIKPG